MEELAYLRDLPCLHTLWLDENPVASRPGYRLATIKLLTRLQKLDNVPITDEERDRARSFDSDRQERKKSDGDEEPTR